MVDEMLVNIVSVNWCVRIEEKNKVWIKIKVVPEVHLAALLTLKAPLHALGGVHSCAKPMALRCKSGICPHIIPTAKPSKIHRVFSPNWKKVKKFRVIHFTRQIIAPSSETVSHSCKCLTFPSPLRRYLGTQGTCMNGVQAMKVGAVTRSEIKCFKKHIHQSQLILYCRMLACPVFVLCTSCIPQKVGINVIFP
jgi:hypothetical protein